MLILANLSPTEEMLGTLVLIIIPVILVYFGIRFIIGLWIFVFRVVREIFTRQVRLTDKQKQEQERSIMHGLSVFFRHLTKF